VLRGWRKPAHLLLDRPKTESGLFAAMQEGSSCVVRFLHEGRACAFDAIIIDWDARRNSPYLRITWPTEVQYVLFRKHERVKLQAPCKVAFSGGREIEGEIRDVSAGGCGVECAEAPAEVPEKARLTFALPDGVTVENVGTVVRSVRRGADGVFLGLEFEPNQERAQNDILFFVTSRLERVSGHEKPGAWVLVIDENADFASRLRRCFERRNTDVIVSANTLDGLLHLRGALPRALLISGAMRDLSAVDTCRLVRGSKGLETLNVYIYGGEAGQVEAAAREAGARKYFAPKPSLAPEMALEVGQEIERTPG